MRQGQGQNFGIKAKAKTSHQCLLHNSSPPQQKISYVLQWRRRRGNVYSTK